MSKTPQPKVYVVTSGVYSDYRIEAIFSTRQAAQKFVGPAEDEDGYGRRIETHDLLASVPDKIVRYHLKLEPSGEVRARSNGMWPWDWTPKDLKPVVVEDEWRPLSHLGAPPIATAEEAIRRGFPFALEQPSGRLVFLHLQTGGTDEEAVRKSFYDHLARRKSEVEGIAS